MSLRQADETAIGNMKILVMSDTHYPITDTKQFLSIISQERPDKIIFLGDNVQNISYTEEFIRLVQASICKDYVFIVGDDDISMKGEKSLTLNLKGRKLIFIHGFQYNLSSEKNTYRIASAFRKINRDLPILGYAVLSKIKSRTNNTYMILGHSHALKFFPRLKVACAGCLTTEKNLYNDRGYLIINAENDSVLLSVNRLGGDIRIFNI